MTRNSPRGLSSCPASRRSNSTTPSDIRLASAIISSPAAVGEYPERIVRTTPSEIRPRSGRDVGTRSSGSVPTLPPRQRAAWLRRSRGPGGSRPRSCAHPRQFISRQTFLRPRMRGEQFATIAKTYNFQRKKGRWGPNSRGRPRATKRSFIASPKPACGDRERPRSMLRRMHRVFAKT